MTPDPNRERFAPGDQPVPPDEQIPEWPADSADWMDREPQRYEDGPLFPEPPAPVAFQPGVIQMEISEPWGPSGIFVRSEGRRLVHEHRQGDQSTRKETYPSEADWEAFWAAADGGRVWDWDYEYPQLGMDMPGWSVLLVRPPRGVCASGGDCPASFFEFCAAVSQLLGGLTVGGDLLRDDEFEDPADPKLDEG